MKKKLLFLAHRIPYPPNKGDKIRSFNILKHLAQTYDVLLGAFADDADDLLHIDFLKSICCEVMIRPLNGRQKRLSSLFGLVTGDALSVRYFRDRALSRWTRKKLADPDVRTVFIYSSTMAQYVLPRPATVSRLVSDLVDLDSAKWLEYAQHARWPMNWVFAREGRQLAAFECRVVTQSDQSSFVSDEEALLYRRAFPEHAGRVFTFRNGVDLEFFDPGLTHPSPYPPNAVPVVFTGAMDYRANVDAVQWYAEHVHPRVRSQSPGAVFFIVGANPTPAVRKLGGIPGVVVSGRVEDIRPYVAHAACIVAPLRIARGLQNKVLEAMAMARPIVATTAALEGIPMSEGVPVLEVSDAEEFARGVLQWLSSSPSANEALSSRRLVQQVFSWESNLARLDEALRSPLTSSPAIERD